MAAVKPTIRDGGTLIAIPVPDRAAPGVRAADAATIAAPSPARLLQQKLHARATVELNLPSHHHGRGSRRELRAFIAGVMLLWGATLGGLGGLVYLAS